VFLGLLKGLKEKIETYMILKEYEQGEVNWVVDWEGARIDSRSI
jgi:hypothetical protein